MKPQQIYKLIEATATFSGVLFFLKFKTLGLIVPARQMLFAISALNGGTTPASLCPAPEFRCVPANVAAKPAIADAESPVICFPSEGITVFSEETFFPSEEMNVSSEGKTVTWEETGLIGGEREKRCSEGLQRGLKVCKGERSLAKTAGGRF